MSGRGEDTGADSAARLSGLIGGFRITQAIHVAAELGLADLLADDARTAEDLAAATRTHAPTLLRLLRALAGIELLREDDDASFSLTPMGELLRSDVPGSLRDIAIFVARPYYWRAWGSLDHSIRTGENAFQHVHGCDVWTYRREHSAEGGIFDRAMQAATAIRNRDLLESFDFGRFGTIVDVGGGNGTFLTAILRRYPSIHGIVFDQPHVVAGEVLTAAGLADRCRIVAGSFFDTVPAGGDAYLMKAILHDWEDKECRAILGACRNAMRQGATLLVVERLLATPESRFSDLNMLVSPGGRERTLEEFAALFREAGFGLREVVPAGVMNVIVAVAGEA